MFSEEPFDLNELDQGAKEGVQVLKTTFEEISKNHENAFKEFDLNEDGTLDSKEFSTAIIGLFTIFSESLNEVKEPFQQLMGQFDLGINSSAIESVMKKTIQLKRKKTKKKKRKKRKTIQLLKLQFLV
jgi:hypothetical protein